MNLLYATTQLNIVIVVMIAVAVIIVVIVYLYKKNQSKYYYTSLKQSSSAPRIKRSTEVNKQGLLVVAMSGEVLFSNKSSIDMLGLREGFDMKALDAAKVLKISVKELISVKDFLDIYRDQVDRTQEFSVRTILAKSGNEIPVMISLGLIGYPTPCYIVAISNLNTEMEISAFRHKDMLTNLPNQYRAVYDIGMEISKMHSQGRHFALILIALDGFTELRAMQGYQKTDKLIVRISEHLQYLVKGMESKIYHMMRNHFLLMVPDIDTADGAKLVVKEIGNGLEALFDYSNTRMPLTFSTGISFFPISGNNVDILIDTAYKALSEAKKQGGGYVIADDKGFFSKDRHYEVQLYSEMQDALKNKEFELYYQPLIAMANGLVWGAEALIRWNHPRRGMVSPIEFIPIAEKTGLIVELGRFVIEEAIKQQKKWEIFKFNKLQVSINLSLREIETGDVVDFIAQTLTRHQVSPALVKFEITENVAMVNADVTKREFERLKKIGVQLALDDFGTGYSSFVYLKDFSLDTLKIDQAFVTDMVHNSEHQKIVRAMIGLGHNFDLQITAEGIEDKATYDMLKEFGCDIAQGYYFSKPLPVFEFQELIRRKVKEA